MCTAGVWFTKTKHLTLSGVNVAVDYFQVVSMMSNFQFQWPPIVLTLFDIGDLLSLNLEITSPQCAIKLDFISQWRMTQLAPLVIMVGFAVALSLVWIGSMISASRRATCRRSSVSKRVTASQMRKDASYQFLNSLIGMAVLTLNFLYIVVLTTGWKMLRCITWEGNSVLAVDRAVDCNGAEYKALLPIAWLAQLAYGLGTILVFAVLTYVHKRSMKDDQELRARGMGECRASNPQFHLRKRLGKLYMDYRPACVWYRLVSLVKKACFSYIAVQFSFMPLLQASAAFCIMFLAYSLQQRYSPFLTVRPVSQVLLQYATVKQPARVMRFWNRKVVRVLASLLGLRHDAMVTPSRETPAKVAASTVVATRNPMKQAKSARKSIFISSSGVRVVEGGDLGASTSKPSSGLPARTEAVGAKSQRVIDTAKNDLALDIGDVPPAALMLAD
jgi:hypothetical protein